jgi:hypothetical protein
VVVVYSPSACSRTLRHVARHNRDGIYRTRDPQRTRKVSLPTEPIPAVFALSRRRVVFIGILGLRSSAHHELAAAQTKQGEQTAQSGENT